MNPITISINDTNYYSESQEHIPRLYDLSKKLCFFVRYLNTNFEGVFLNGGVSGINNGNLGCYFLINGTAMRTGGGDPNEAEIRVSSADNLFLSREYFDDNEFNQFAGAFLTQLEQIRSFRIKRRAL
jgi:hypothetical protein